MSKNQSVNKEKLYIVLISVHGLIRGRNLELGNDADTGGQTKYVVELAQALGKNDRVGRVDLLTQKVIDPQVSKDYARPFENISDKVRIVRIDCCDNGYVPKEGLWDFLDNFADQALDFIRGQEKLPDIIHSHYADAGYVAVKLTRHLAVPLVHTGHSLGRVKRRSLLASGLKPDDIEKKYNISRRINAEEDTLGAARLIIASTHQEIEGQYGLYDYYQPQQMCVIPPGTDLNLFQPPRGDEYDTPIYRSICRFLAQPEKPVILAISRADKRKNISTLIEAYGESPELQAIANLVIIAGNRNDISDLDDGAREVISDLLAMVDQQDLYGRVAYPKHHRTDDIPSLYRLAAQSGGVFINPALTEPFGLTLIEAAACGLPVVATEDGGPRDIISNCKNGYLVNPLDRAEISRVLLKVINEKTVWKKMSLNGIRGVHDHYSWDSHVSKYLDRITPLVDQTVPVKKASLYRRPTMYHGHAIFSDLDQSLLGDTESLQLFIRVIQDNKKCIAFGIVTGRRLDSALKDMKKNRIPLPDVLISSLGTEIHYAPDLTLDTAWTNHIEHLWNPRAVRRILAKLPGIKAQPKSEQGEFKISYYIDPEISPDIDEINRLLHQHEQAVNVFISFGQFLDIVPARASKGYALRWVAEQWGIPLENILVAGGSGADEDMMRGNTKAVVVANRHDEELSDLMDVDRVYFAEKPYAEGILDAIDHYAFLDACKVTEI
ncbi:MAG TPA: HAD-IIB family hydrolase [Gammaproteobacteria bacterium]|nr:HAD-IIB family hydrolase [Gammaproteobacteria bacterium]